MRNKAYIAGPITGEPDYQQKFLRAKIEIMSATGFVVLDPSILPWGLTTEEYMRIDLTMMSVADVVVLLPGWEKSNGAKVEKLLAQYENKPVYTLEQFLKEAKTDGV